MYYSYVSVYVIGLEHRTGVAAQQLDSVSMAIVPCALPTPKLASRMRLSSFPFPRRPSASPRPLRLRAPKPAAPPPPARLRRNQTTHAKLARGQYLTSSSESGPAPRRAFSRLVSACPDWLAVHGRPQLAALRARCPVTPLTTLFPPPPSSLRPETRCESATCTLRAACAGASSRRTSRAVVGARGSPNSHSRGSTFV